MPLNLTSISKSAFFEVVYKCNVDENSPKMPLLTKWLVSEFTDTRVKFQLFFENPLYVSTGEIPDTVTITFAQPLIFVSRSGRSLAYN